MASDVQSRKWQLTINNPQKKQLTHDEIKQILREFKSIQYYCMSDEIARTHHTHVYILFKSPVRFSTIKNKFPKAHIEKAYGTSLQNQEYVYKEGKWENDKKKETNLSETHEEWGEMPEERQGARNDCAELYEMVTEGRSNYEILEENPDFIKQIDRIDKVRQIIQEEEFKDIFRKLEVKYIYGDTGSGKTRGVMKKYGYSNVYRVTNYKNPFDQYQGQDVIIFEEFVDSLPINQILLYLDGYPVMLPCRYADKVAVEQDYAKAVEWYEKAANLGNSRAMNNIGYMYQEGLGVEQDYTKAMEWYAEAANLGNAVAMNNIGNMYAFGLGVEQDYVKALECLEKAADIGSVDAMNNIGFMYEKGLGVEQDLSKAQEWYDKAAAAQ